MNQYIFRTSLKNDSNSLSSFHFNRKLNCLELINKLQSIYFCILIFIFVLASRIYSSRIFYNYINILYKTVYRIYYYYKYIIIYE